MVGRDTADRAMDLQLFDWMPAGQFQLSAGLLIDPLSMAFVLLITFVGSLIHVYSLGYMEHDPDKRRFFAYLNLFVAAMLVLVLADSLPACSTSGWEGVGLASYLLIGFWNYNPAYATAANKAFVANRVGDVGLSVAIMMMFWQFGKVDFASVNAGVGQASQGAVTAIGLLLLLGACGKSAQFPLQSWLGDAMAGPTPVSALIHAATMVTAGVYLVVRSNVIFDAAPTAQVAVAIVGAITLLFGAIVGCAKDDMKKALAASTMSQIGYMMLAAGLGPVGYAFAIFHLLTHGFFKAGMFLGAGSVMHAMNDQVDMRRFGGLWSVIRITAITFGLGCLAIIGFPFLDGFWSKDKIIESAFIGEGWQPWVFGGAALIGAAITAFYMSRLFFMTFLGKKRWTDDVHPHESPLTMTIPMIVLAVGSAFLGLILGPTNFIANWLDAGRRRGAGGAPGHRAGRSSPSLTLLLVAAGVGPGLAALRARRRCPRSHRPAACSPRPRARTSTRTPSTRRLLMRPGHPPHPRRWSSPTARESTARSGGLAALVGGTSGRMRRLQNGFARSYALTMLAGVVVILGALWVMQ